MTIEEKLAEFDAMSFRPRDKNPAIQAILNIDGSVGVNVSESNCDDVKRLMSGYAKEREEKNHCKDALRECVAMLKKAIKQRDDFIVRMSGDFDLAKLKEQRDAELLRAGEGTLGLGPAREGGEMSGETDGR